MCNILSYKCHTIRRVLGDGLFDTRVDLPWAIVEGQWAEKNQDFRGSLRDHGTSVLFADSGWRYHYAPTFKVATMAKASWAPGAPLTSGDKESLRRYLREALRTSTAWLAAAMLAVTVLGAACASGGTASSKATTFPTPPVLPDGACVARMLDDNPGGQFATVLVDAHLKRAPVRITAHYSTKEVVHGGTTDGRGHGDVKFVLGHPIVGFPVAVDVVVGDAAGGEKCQTRFSPRVPGGTE